MKDFDILELGQLPEPEIPYKITTEKHILNKLSEDWMSESLGKKMWANSNKSCIYHSLTK